MADVAGSRESGELLGNFARCDDALSAAGLFRMVSDGWSLGLQLRYSREVTEFLKRFRGRLYREHVLFDRFWLIQRKFLGRGFYRGLARALLPAGSSSDMEASLADQIERAAQVALDRVVASAFALHVSARICRILPSR